MKTARFKTNINCEKCLGAVTPFLNQIPNISWYVNTEQTDKILTVKSDDDISDKVIEKVKEAGFKIEFLSL